MKILHLAHRIPYPPNKGDKIRTYNILRHLSEKHEVSLAAIVDDPKDLVMIDKLRGHAQSIIYAQVRGRFSRALASLRLLIGQSATVSYFYREDLQRQIDEMLDESHFDAVICSSSPMAEYVFRSRHVDGKLASAIRVMDLIDVDSVKWSQYADRARLSASWFYRRESRYLSAYERRIYREFDRLILVSDQEKVLFPGSDFDNKLMAVPNGVDLDYFRPRDLGNRNSPPAICFTGMMDYWPNIDAMKWFVHRVFPALRQSNPDIELKIVGGRPTREVRALSREVGVSVTGYVDDVRDFMSNSHLCVAPLRIARGLQNKVLEAMSMGRPVVASAEALKGIGASDGEHVISADSADGFVDAISDLLADTERAERIGANARKFVECHFSWHENLRGLDEALEASSGKRTRDIADSRTRSFTQ